MRVIPVIDLMGGVVVRGVAGRRDEYRPIESTLADDASPAGIGAALRRHFRPEITYVADLDAIGGGEPDWSSYRVLSECGLRLWVDAGLGSVERARPMLERGGELSIERLIVGLESLPDAGVLRGLIDLAGSDRLVFSLDMKDGRLLSSSPAFGLKSPEDVAAMAVSAGIDTLIVLDLARVGMAAGTGTNAMCEAIARQFPHVQLIAGGGVRSVEDLRNLQKSGCAGALVASALHDGSLTSADVLQLAQVQ